MKLLPKRNGGTAMLIRIIAFILCVVTVLGMLGCTSSDKTPPAPENDPPANNGAEDGGDEDKGESKNIVLNAFYVPMYSEEIRDKMIALCAEAEIDVISHVMTSEVWDPEEHTFEFYKAAMAKADEYGIKMLTREKLLHNSIALTNKEARDLAKKYKDLPGFGGFYVVDEPYNPSPYARIENALKDICPDARVNVNFLPINCYGSSIEGYLRQLCDYAGLLEAPGVLSLDCYCFPNGGGVDEMNLFLNYEAIRRAGLTTGCDTAVYVQSVGMIGGFNYRRPSEADLRYNMMSALAYGVKEIQFFTFGSPGTQDFTYTDGLIDINCEPTELFYSVCGINKKIHTIGTHLASCDAKQVYHSVNTTDGAYDILPEELFVKAGDGDVIVSLMEEREGDGEYVMVVNKDIINSQKLTLTFDGMDRVCLVDDATGELVERMLDGGRLDVELVAGDCVLIKLPSGDFITEENEKSENLALGAFVSGTSSSGERGLYLYNLTDGVTSGNEGVRVSSNLGVDQFLTVDLGDVYSVNRIDIYPLGEGRDLGSNNLKNFKLLVSEDGETFTEVASNTEQLPKEGVSTFRFDTAKARYVRVRIIGLKGANCADIAELEVYCEK